jgi:bacterioferritin
MERDQFVSSLNEDLELEYESIIQYIQHVATVKGAEFQATLEELRKHVSQELQHALTLAEQVDFLGGTPSTRSPEIKTYESSRAALEADLRLEEAQLERYRERTEQANGLGLPDVAEALAPLLEQTQEHARDLRAALG